MQKFAPLTPAGTLFALVSGMAYREFLDSSGQSWRVWSTVPTMATRLHGGFDQGWLTFECTSPDCRAPLRRLCPIPPDWETLPESRLELMCKAADEVTRPKRGRSKPPEEAADQ